LANSASLASQIAARYAASLFEVAQESNALDATLRDLDAFAALLGDSDDLMRLARSPMFSAQDQGRAIAAVLAKAGIGGIVANTLRLMARNRRLFAAPEIAGEFRKLLAAHRGETVAEVTSAQALSAAQLERLREALAAVAGRQVAIRAETDPALIGGMVVKMGSRQIDTSIRTKLSSLKLALKEVG
jgi:F-type H+-transporting ATPase subunit delta